jgi:hypothetical protein
LTEAFYLVTWQAVVTALLAGAALGWVFSIIRPGIEALTFLRSGTAIAILWFVPGAIVRLLDPNLFVNGIRTIGPALLFEAFIAVGAVTVAYRNRRKA